MCRIAITLAFLFTAAVANAAVPQLINYQGRLTDNAGNPVGDGSHSVVFNIYDDSVAGTTLWGETQSVTTANGFFAVSLGSVTPLLETVFPGSARFLGITVGADPEMTPRTSLVTVPYAFHAGSAHAAIVLPIKDSVSSADPAVEITNTGAGSAGRFVGVGAAVALVAEKKLGGSGGAFYATSSNAGTAGFFDNNSASPTVDVENTGPGSAGLFSAGGGKASLTTLSTGSSHAFSSVVTSAGTGGSAFFEIAVVSNSSPVVEVINTDGAGVGAHIEIQRSTNAMPALEAKTLGTGSAGKFEIDNAANTSPALEVYNLTGAGVAGSFEILSGNAFPSITTRTNGGGAAIEAINTGGGAGSAGYFEIASDTSTGIAVQALSKGDGYATLVATKTGAGRAGHFSISNTLNIEDALYVRTNGLGDAGLFEIDNASNVEPALEATTNGTGSAGLFLISNASNTSAALYATSAGGTAGYFEGDVHIDGVLSKSSGSFRIDHPLEPESKYLQHSFVESPDMMNVYNGNVTTGADGRAIVTLPDYFAALNRDFRYQLTVIGQFAQAIVAEKISENQFTIETDKPNVEVSWQVTGIRQDKWANENRIKVELNKPVAELGKAHQRCPAQLYNLDDNAKSAASLYSFQNTICQRKSKSKIRGE